MTMTLSRRSLIFASAAIILIVAAVITWLSMGNGTPDSVAAPAQAAPTHTQAEAAYLDQIQTAQVPLSGDEALRLGRDQCKGWDSLRDGRSVDFLTGPGSLEQLAQDGKLATAQVRSIENASVQFLCPANLEYRQSHTR